MSKLLYDFLTESFLFSGSENLWATHSDAEIEKELETYQAYAIKVFPQLVSMNGTQPKISTFAGFEMPDLSLLKQLGLYLDVFFIYDPIFSFRGTRTDNSRSINSILGYDPASNVDRNKLKKSVDYVKSLTPFVVGNYVQLIPFDLTPDFSKGIPIYWSENYFDELLPEELRRWFHERVIVKSLEKTDKGWRKMDALKPTRGICIDFKDDQNLNTRIYHLFDQEIMSFEEDTGKAICRMSLPSEPPDTAYFQAWVHQSINRAAHDIYREVFLENIVCANLGNAFYLTASGLINDLLQVGFQPKNGLAEDVTNILLHLNLPVLPEVDASEFMRIRDSHSDSFQRFRSYLEGKVSELRSEQNSVVLSRKIADLEYEMRETNLRDIATNLQDVRRLLAIDAALVTGSLVTSFLTGGWGVIPSACAAVQAIKTYDEYRNKVRNNPSFIYWKLNRSK